MTKPLLSIPTFSHPSGDDGPKKGTDEGVTNSLHLSKYGDYLYNFHVADEGLDKFAVEVDEEDVEAVDSSFSQFLQNNISNKFRRSMAVHSQIEVPTEEAEKTMPTENLPLEVVQIEPCKRKGRNVNKSHITITPSHRQANRRKNATIQIRASRRIAN